MITDYGISLGKPDRRNAPGTFWTNHATSDSRNHPRLLKEPLTEEERDAVLRMRAKLDPGPLPLKPDAGNFTDRGAR